MLEIYRGCDDFGEFMWGFGGVLKIVGGEAGIRTLGTFRYTCSPNTPNRPLSHLSNIYVLIYYTLIKVNFKKN